MFRIAQSFEDVLKTFIIRGIVFIEEQDVIYNEEIDEFEFTALHILGEIDGEPVAAARLRFLGDYAKLERVAVRKAYRGRGIAHSLVDYLVELARNHGFTQYKMHAQSYLLDFYRKHGFEKQGDLFMEAGIEHYLMVRHDD